MEKAICVVCLLLLLLWDWGSYIKDPILLFSLVGEKRVGVPNASSTVAKLTTSGLGSGLVGGPYMQTAYHCNDYYYYYYYYYSIES